MSIVKIQGNASGTGEFTLASPNGNTNRTITLPDATGTVALQGGAGVGKVLQVVQAAYTTLNTIVSSTSYGNVFSASITPTSSSNKILVLGSICACPSVRSGTRSSVFSRLALFRNGTAGTKLYETLFGTDFPSSVGATYFGPQAQHSICYLDSPSTVSATTYNIAIAARSDTTDICTVINSNNADTGASPSSYIVVLEIAA